MPEISCSYCGHRFEVSEDVSGLFTTCPSCSRQISVPGAEGKREGAGRLQLKREEAARDGRPCPSCGAELPAGAVLCVECGYDSRTGIRYGDAPAQGKARRFVMLVAGIAIAAGGFLAWNRQRTPAAPLSSPPPAPAATTITSEPDPAPSTSAPEPLSEEETAVEGGQADVASSETEDPVEDEPAGMSDDERALVEKQFREVATTRLERQFPLHAVGDLVEVRRANGLVHRGHLLKMTDEEILVETEAEVVEIPLSALDRRSRVGFDKAFRAGLVEHQVRKQMSELKSP